MKNTTIIPNILFECGLSCEDIAVYCLCSKFSQNSSGNFLVKYIGMILSMDVEKFNICLGRLSVPQEKLCGKSFIKLKTGKNGYDLQADVTDVWFETDQYFKEKEEIMLKMKPKKI